jgi:hypothetical protein
LTAYIALAENFHIASLDVSSKTVGLDSDDPYTSKFFRLIARSHALCAATAIISHCSSRSLPIGACTPDRFVDSHSIDSHRARSHLGCIEGQPTAEYHGDRSAVSSSALKQMLISPAHCLRYLNEGREETPAMLTGTMLHAALLEPDRFATEFAMVPVVRARR